MNWNEAINIAKEESAWKNGVKVYSMQQMTQL